jgi:hypothetical protein
MGCGGPSSTSPSNQLPAPGSLVLSAATLDFGSVVVGSSSALNVTASNRGQSGVPSSATISQDTVTGAGFSVSGLNPPVTLTSGQSVTFSIVFAPQSQGSASGNLMIASNGSSPMINIPLSGTGTAPGQLSVSPSNLAFGNVVEKTASDLTATLSAVGASVTISSVNMSSSEFTLSGISFPTTLMDGKSAQFTVTFLPQFTGAVSSTASFASDASNSPTVLLLGGTGAPPVHSVVLNWTASTSTSIIGYNMYRGTSASGPFSQINPSLIPGLSYTDKSVVDGTTYYYEATAVDSNNQESEKSTPPAQAFIPPP